MTRFVTGMLFVLLVGASMTTSVAQAGSGSDGRQCLMSGLMLAVESTSTAPVTLGRVAELQQLADGARCVLKCRGRRSSCKSGCKTSSCRSNCDDRYRDCLTGCPN